MILLQKSRLLSVKKKYINKKKLCDTYDILECVGLACGLTSQRQTTLLPGAQLEAIEPRVRTFKI